jgi:hypothetical protein
MWGPLAPPLRNAFPPHPDEELAVISKIYDQNRDRFGLKQTLALAGNPELLKKKTRTSPRDGFPKLS